MNPETGRIYAGEPEIAAAEARGEKLIRLEHGIADDLAALEQQQQAKATLNRAQRRAQRFGHKQCHYSGKVR